jgi:hypothetical protein
VNDLETYQQVFLYVVPIITNIMFINGMVVLVRLYWFRLRLKEEIGMSFSFPHPPSPSCNQQVAVRLTLPSRSEAVQSREPS